jgi:type II secretory pathway pseudopilin PulG
MNYLDRGDTLIEILMALIVLGIAGLTLLVNLSTETNVSAQYRNLAEMNAVLRGVGTSVQYQIENIDGIFSCSDPSVVNPSQDVATYYNTNLAGLVSSTSPLAGTYQVPANYSAEISTVNFWDSSNNDFGSQSSTTNCPPVATETQQLVVTVTFSTPSLTFSRSENVIVYQPTRPLDNVGS